MSIQNKIEAKIARKLLMDARAKGYLISVYDGEEWVVKKETSITIVMSALGSTDSDQLRFRDPNLTERGGYVGTVSLIYGNGCDVISDWTVDAAGLMEALMTPVEAWTNNLPNA